MATVHQLRFEETGRAVSHVATSVQATATWEVHDLREHVDVAEYVVDSGSATITATSVSLTDDAGPDTANDRRLTVGSTALVESGRTYLLTSTAGSELVRVVGFTANASIDLAHPVVGSYTSGLATLEGVTMDAALADAIAATEDYVDFDDPLRIVWTYADGEKHQQQIRVVRQDFDDFDPAGVVEDVKALFPDVGTRSLHRGGDTLLGLARAQYRQVRAQKLADGEEPERYLHGEQGHWVLVWGVLLHLAAKGEMPGQENEAIWYDHCRGEHKKFYGNVRGQGQAGSRTAHIAPISESATGTTDGKTRSRIRFG